MSAFNDLLNNYRRISIAGVPVKQRPNLNIVSGATGADNNGTNSTDMTMTGSGAGFPASPQQGDLVYWNGSAWVSLHPGTSGQALETLGAGANPQWQTVSSLPSSPEQGDIAYYNGSAWANLAPGTNGQFLKTQGAGANPIWATIGSLSIGNALSHETGDVTLTTSPGNLASSVSLSGSVFLVAACAGGLSGGATTPILQVTVDGTVPSYFTFYGPSVPATGNGCGQAFYAVASGLSSASHTFQLKGAVNGGTWTVHASSNPTREGAWLVVLALAP